MYNSLVRIKGWLTEANIIEPVTTWADNEAKFKFTIYPSNNDYTELEEQIKFFEFETEQPHFKVSEKEYDSYNCDWVTRKRKTVIEGCNILFESIYPPKLIGEIQMMDRDDELIGTHVQAVGHLQRLDNGDTVLSCHLLENCFEPTPEILDSRPLVASDDWF